jgi:L-asparaginase
VAVLATGGTIATRTDGPGTAVARVSGRELAYELPLPPGGAVEAEDVGTDTTEETAMFLDLDPDDSRPIVLAGAQRPADAPDRNGPRNLADAMAVAAHPAARGLGTLLVFDGVVPPAWGAAKSQTLASAAFSAATGPLGWVRGGALHVEAGPRRRPGPALRSVDLNASSSPRCSAPTTTSRPYEPRSPDT